MNLPFRHSFVNQLLKVDRTILCARYALTSVVKRYENEMSIPFQCDTGALLLRTLACRDQQRIELVILKCLKNAELPMLLDRALFLVKSSSAVTAIALCLLYSSTLLVKSKPSENFTEVSHDPRQHRARGTAMRRMIAPIGTLSVYG